MSKSGSFEANRSRLLHSSKAHSVVVERGPGGLVQAVDQQREISLLEGVRHCGQGPVQRFTEVQSAGPVQALLHHPVRHPTQLHGLQQGGGDEGRSRRHTLILSQKKQFTPLFSYGPALRWFYRGPDLVAFDR